MISAQDTLNFKIAKQLLLESGMEIMVFEGNQNQSL